MNHLFDRIFLKKRKRVYSQVRRMLAAFKDVPGFVSLKKILVRPFFYFFVSRDTTETMERLHRISKFLNRECYEIRVFDALLGHMTREEKARHVAPLGDVFKGLMERHRKRFSANRCNCTRMARDYVTKFATLYVELLRETAQDTSGELVRFVECVMGTIPVELESLLENMDPNAVDYVLTCFSVEQYHACDIRASDLLMRKMLADKHILSAVLMRHGFKYSFNEKYYLHCCRELIEMDLLPEEPPHMRSPFMESANLRMQMAAEILVCLLTESGMNEDLICTLWRTLPDPFITPEELYHLFEPFFVQGEFVHVLVDACTLYQELIPGVPRVKEPRSLKHLARVRIRESMVQAHSIGERAIRNLGLPELIEDYLWKLEAF